MYANGSRYVGQWEHNKKVGHGTFTFEDGSVYDGPFVDDRMAEGKVQQQVDIFACLDLKPYLAREADNKARRAIILKGNQNSIMILKH